MEVMSDEIVGETISWAGGLPRQFLQLRSTAAHQALTDGLDRIEKESFTRARIRVADRWQYQLQPADYSALERDDTERTADERARLLRLGALIEYDKQDGFLRIGINPLVRPLMKREKQKAS
jgi:hypothetical protein